MAIAWISRASNSVTVRLSLPEIRNSLAPGPPPAYRFPCESCASAHKYAVEESNSSEETGAMVRRPSLRSEIFFGFPFSNSAYSDCVQVRVLPARHKAAPASSAMTIFTLLNRHFKSVASADHVIERQ